jgi:cell filamentation protein
MLDKYGTGQDPYCYPGTRTMRNRLGFTDENYLSLAERDISASAANEIEFTPPPYDFSALRSIHRHLFSDLYEWAGEIRSVDISKGSTHFCTVGRIEPEVDKLLKDFEKSDWFAGLDRPVLITAVAQLYGDLNMVHPFRDGNGRAQRILFEHIIINAGYEISWQEVDASEWAQANVDAVVCDYAGLETIFERCIGQRIPL